MTKLRCDIRKIIRKISLSNGFSFHVLKENFSKKRFPLSRLKIEPWIVILIGIHDKWRWIIKEKYYLTKLRHNIYKRCEISKNWNEFIIAIRLLRSTRKNNKKVIWKLRRDIHKIIRKISLSSGFSLPPIVILIEVYRGTRLTKMN